MAFADIKNNQASRKFYLIRLRPSRFVNDDLSAIGGGLYTMTFPYPIGKVEENGIELTYTSGTPTSGQYSYNESTNLLTAYPVSAPGSSNAIVVSYYLFYTGERFRVVTEDPEDTGTTKRDWLPRIDSSPTITNSVENVLAGKLSINASRLTVINNELEFQNYLTDNDSFYQKEAKVWLCLEDTANIQKVFDGNVIDIGISKGSDGEKVTITFDDPLGLLKDPALMGDDSEHTYWTINDYANLDPNRNNTPIPIYFGRVSRYQLIRDTAVSGLATAKKIDPTTVPDAVNTNKSDTISTTTNREWGICRTVDGFSDFSFTPSNIDNSAGGYTRLDGSAAQVELFHAGDTFIVNDGGVDRYVRCFYVDRTNNYLYVTKQGLLTTGDDVEANDCPVIIVTNEVDQTYYCEYGRDYTTTTAATAGGNVYLKITFTNNFEANHSGLTTLDPGQYRVKYRIKPDTTNAKHGSVLKTLLELAGLTVNTASITAANSALNVNANFSIPGFRESDHRAYYNYIQNILESSLGYIALNNSFEIEYGLFATPSSTTEITDTDILINTFRVEIDYEDIIHQLIAYNPNYASEEATEDPNNSPSVTEISNKAKYLHGINKTVRFVHVLEEMNTRLPSILGYRSNRTVKYIFDSKISQADSIIGDNFLLNKSGLLGNDSTKDIVIVSLKKSPKRTTVIASDLLGV